MIKNIVFDLGHVLVNFHPETFLEKHVPKEKQEKIRACIFGTPEWYALDRASITEEEALAAFIQRLPEEEALLRDIFPKYLADCLSPNEENIAIARELKEKGYQLYVLSNFHKGLFETIEAAWPIFNIFDGKVVSCYCQALKPEVEIYEELFRTTGILPEESLFVDDKAENIAAGEALGMRGLHLPVQADLPKNIWKRLEELA